MRWEIPTEGKKAIPSIAVGVLALVCGLVVPPAAFGTGPSSDGDGALSSSVFGIAARCLPPPSVPDCDPSQPVTMPHGETMALDPGTYGDVVVQGGGTGPGTLTLTVGHYVFCNLHVSRKANLFIDGPAQVDVVGTMRLDNASSTGAAAQIDQSWFFSPATACGADFFVAGDAVRLSRNAQIAASVCAPNAVLNAESGAALHGGFSAAAIRAPSVTTDPEYCSGRADPSRVDFGDVPLNTSVTQTIVVTIDAGYALGGGSGGLNPPFALDFGDCTFDLSGPGTCTVSETFTPTVTGTFGDTLGLDECPVAGGGGCIRIGIPLVGNGVSVAAANPSDPTGS
jgi:hypothetical protein